VLSRIDGTQTIREVLLTTGLPVERAVAIVSKLRSLGALLLPNETTAPTSPQGFGAMPAARAAHSPENRAARDVPLAGAMKTVKPPVPIAPRAVTSAARAEPEEVAVDTTLPAPSAEELAALHEDVELSDDERRHILALHRLVGTRDPYVLFGVPADSDPKLLKRAYFRLSKDIHPDRYYGKRLGSFAERLNVVFETVSRYYARITAGGDAARQSGACRAVQADRPQTPQEYAAELFNRACQVEVGGDALEAMKLFAAAVRLDAQAKYLRRATSCALAARQPKTAVEYAKKAHAQAPNDPSVARLLASAFRAAGKLADAEEVLVLAMAIKSENDALAAELRRDLAEVRRLLLAAQ
jgi:tetratricopeptide (TPR) repeat protein